MTAITSVLASVLERDGLLTPAEVGDIFRVDSKTVTRWADTGLLESTRTPGNHRRFYAEQVYRILAAGHTPGGRKLDKQPAR